MKRTRGTTAGRGTNGTATNGTSEREQLRLASLRARGALRIVESDGVHEQCMVDEAIRGLIFAERTFRACGYEEAAHDLTLSIAMVEADDYETFVDDAVALAIHGVELVEASLREAA
jgi:hypothetical protein